MPRVPHLGDLAVTAADLRNPQSILEFLDAINEKLEEFDLSTEVTLPGLLSGDLLTATARLIQWPCRKAIEPYAVLLQEAVSSRTLDLSSSSIKDAFAAFDVIPVLETILTKLDAVVEDSIANTPAITQGTISKLDARITRMERDIEYLESRLQSVSPTSKMTEELTQKLQARRKALIEDKKRRMEIIASAEDMVSSLRERADKFKRQASKLIEELQYVQNQARSVVYPGLSLESSMSTTLLVPLTIVGFSRKGVLETTIIPPLRFIGSNQRAGRRREFVDPFVPADDALVPLVRMLESRIDDDVTLMKFIRDSAEASNILSVKFTRHLLKDGADLLRADGLVSASAIKSLDELLSQFKERHLAITDATIITGSDSSCEVRFHITDEEGSPVSNAVLTLGPLSARSDSQGTIRISLPRSSYTGTIKAEDFKDRPIELAFRNPGEYVVPVILKRLDAEELLARSIDQLEERAERIATARKRLSQAFEKHGDTFLNVPSYRSALASLLTEMGYDPDAWIAQARRESGMMQRFLKGEARADDLRRVILRLGEDTHKTGGIMLFSELLVRLDKLGWHTTPNEVEEVLNSLAKEGLIQGVSTQEGGSKIIVFVPVTLTDDPRSVLTLAAQNNGELTIEDVVVGLGWAENRAKTVLDLLVERGVAKMQRSYSRSTKYWFPGLRKKR